MKTKPFLLPILLLTIFFTTVLQASSPEQVVEGSRWSFTNTASGQKLFCVDNEEHGRDFYVRTHLCDDRNEWYVHPKGGKFLITHVKSGQFLFCVDNEIHRPNIPSFLNNLFSRVNLNNDENNDQYKDYDRNVRTHPYAGEPRNEWYVLAVDEKFLIQNVTTGQFLYCVTDEPHGAHDLEVRTQAKHDEKSLWLITKTN